MSKVADTEQPRKLSLEMPDDSIYVAGEDDEVDVSSVYKYSNHDALDTQTALPPDYYTPDCAKALAGMAKITSPNTPPAPMTEERRNSLEQMKYVDEIVSDVIGKMLKHASELENKDPQVDYEEDVDEEDVDEEDVDADDVDADDVDEEDVDEEDVDADDELEHDNISENNSLDDEEIKTIMNTFDQMSKDQAIKQMQQWNSNIDEDKFREQNYSMMKEFNIDTPEETINLKLNEVDDIEFEKFENYIDEINNNILEYNDADISEEKEEENPKEKYLKNLENKMTKFSEELNEKQLYLEDLRASIDNKIIKLNKKANKKHSPVATFISNFSVVFFFSWGILKVVNFFGSR